ncbi:MAG: helix-turn-helix domain-containing protein [Hyphomonadaceae bacterium]|nr:helix-turn-helix domain-containing protein [Hyphomonadaceae bacterium]
MTDAREATTMDAQIGERIRRERLAQGVSQERLAEALGITFQQIQKYEKGVNRVAASRLYDIAAALKAPIKRFLPDPRGVQ